jgi:hypothetical protein
MRPRPGGDPASARITARLPELIDRMFELADGVRVQDDETGVTYARPPERAAIEYLLNRVLGRPGPSKGEPDSVAFEGRVTIVLPDNGRGVVDGDSTAAGPAEPVSCDAG